MAAQRSDLIQKLIEEEIERAIVVAKKQGGYISASATAEQII